MVKLGCGVCSKRNRYKGYDVMGGYKYLTDRQIKARLEVFKKKFCTSCPSRYDCDFAMYNECKIRPR